MSTAEVIAGTRRWHVECADALDFLRSVPDRAVAMTLSSPPFAAQRTYGVGFSRAGEDWVAWMVPIVVEACRVTDGLVFINAMGPVEDGSYSPIIEWLVADLTRHHGIVCGPSPYCYFRHGVPGSGGTRYHRRDWEPVYALCLPDRLPLKWSDNCALGHPPKWAPGGEMSNRLADGSRVNKWGMTGNGPESLLPSGKRRKPSPSSTVVVGEEAELEPGLFGPMEPPAEGPDVNQWGGHETTGRSTKKDGTKQEAGRPSHKYISTRATKDGTVPTLTTLPALANPGSVIRESYSAEDVRQILMGGEPRGKVAQGSAGGDVVRALVGGGHMGNKKAHDSEAPFSEVLVEFFVRSFAPPGGVCMDVFAGSGTVAAVAVRHGRRFIGSELRQTQVDIARERVEGETLPMFIEGPAPVVSEQPELPAPEPKPKKRRAKG